jgi:hypothetical protein
MKRIESVKCNMIHEDFSTVIDEIQFEEARLIHEHYFVPVRLKGAKSFRYLLYYLWRLLL